MKTILKILEQDARTPADKLATMSGKPVEQVAQLVKQAEQDGTIVKYKTVVNWEKLGEQPVMALIEVKVTPERDHGFNAVAERIYRFPEARSVYLLSGDYDLAVLVTAKSMQEISDFVAQKLAPLEQVRSTITHFIMKRFKEDGDILVGTEQRKRLPMTP